MANRGISVFRQKLQTAREIRATEGNVALLKETVDFVYFNFIRKWLPVSGYDTKAGIPVETRKPLDFLAPGVTHSDDPEHEYALVSELRSHVEPGDTTVVVGAGSGTTSVIAANQAGETGSVIAFEGSGSRVQGARNTASLNGVQDRCEIRHAIVGPAIHLSSNEKSTSSVKHLPPGQLPECDVLELDCEGAEEQILENLEVSPKVVIVETHPHLAADTEEIETILGERGYRVINRIDRGSVPVLTAVRDSDNSDGPSV